MKFSTGTEHKALIYDISQFQKCGFRPNPITSNFTVKKSGNPELLVLKFGRNRIEIKITFLESGNIIDERPVLGLRQKSHSYLTKFSKTQWDGRCNTHVAHN